MGKRKSPLSRLSVAVWVLLFVVGASATLAAFQLPSDSGWRPALFSIGISIVATTTITVIDALFGTDTFSRLSALEDKMEVRLGQLGQLVDQLDGRTQERLGELGRLIDAQKLYKAGLRGAYADDTKATESGFLSAHLEGATHVDMLHNAGRNTIRTYRRALENAIKSNRCVVRVLMADPSSNLWGDSALNRSLAPDSKGHEPIRQIIEETKQMYETMAERLRQITSPDLCGSLEVRLYQGISPSNMIIIDDAFIRHTPRLILTHSEDVPVFDFEGHTGDGSLVDRYINSFEDAWKDSSDKQVVSFNVEGASRR